MITGHRPDRLGGYSNYVVKSQISSKLKECLERIKKTASQKELTPVAISGMALGVDQWWASEAIKQQVQCYAYVPFVGQERKWPIHAQENYKDILNKCHKEVIVSPEGYAHWKMHKRDRAMVDDADICIAVYDGKPGGGTATTLEYIRKQGKPCLVINPSTLEEKWENVTL